MSGFNANFRNSATDKDYTLNRDAGHGSAAVFQLAPPQEGLNSIDCGETVQDALTETTFKSLFRFEDVIARQRYYSVLFGFRIDSANSGVLLYVRSNSFRPFATVFRNATNKFEVDREQSTDSELVIPINVTDELTGPFILEVSSEEPYATGDFEVELQCDLPEPFGPIIIIERGVEGFSIPSLLYSGSDFNFPAHWPLYGPPPDFDDDNTDYVWSLVPGQDTHGLLMDADGTLHGTYTGVPPFEQFPAHPPTSYHPAIDDGLPFIDNQPSGYNFSHLFGLQIKLTGDGPNAGTYRLAIEVILKFTATVAIVVEVTPDVTDPLRTFNGGSLGWADSIYPWNSGTGLQIFRLLDGRPVMDGNVSGIEQFTASFPWDLLFDIDSPTPLYSANFTTDDPRALSSFLGTYNISLTGSYYDASSGITYDFTGSGTVVIT